MVQETTEDEEEPQEVQVQEEDHPLRQVGSQEVTIPLATPHHSRQEEQAFQAVIHKHLQGSHNLIVSRPMGSTRPLTYHLCAEDITKNAIVPNLPKEERDDLLIRGILPHESSAKDRHCVMCPTRRGLTKAPAMLSML